MLKISFISYMKLENPKGTCAMIGETRSGGLKKPSMATPRGL